MKEKMINIGIGVLLGVIITSICFTIYINAKGIGKRHDFRDQPQIKQSQDFRRDDKKTKELPNGEKPNTTNGSPTNTQSTQKPQENVQEQSNS